MGDLAELLDIAHEPIGDVDRRLREIADEDRELVVRTRAPIGVDEEGDVLVRQTPGLGEGGIAKKRSPRQASPIVPLT